MTSLDAADSVAATAAAAADHQEQQQRAETDDATQAQPQQQPQPQQEIILDSLPYIDYSHPDYEAYAASLIEEEMSKFQPRDTISLAHLGPNPLDTEPKFGGGSGRGGKINRTEYAALASRDGAPRPPGSGYVPPATHTADLPPPPADIANDEQKLRDAISQAKIQLESHRNRLTNLELQAEFESDIWRHYNTTIENGPIKILDEGLAAQRARVDDVNARRKTAQEEDAAPRLSRLGARWEELVGNNLRLRDATRLLEEEVERMRKEAGEEEEEKEVKEEKMEKDVAMEM